ncbi:MAG TPA: hypothetical protein VLG76_01160 [Rhabdochlamydiaceae bacterium]|nr:hypothetical protein [Rhabdochlamydiaceae bacterium]
MVHKVDSKGNILQLPVSNNHSTQRSISSNQASSIQSIQPPTRQVGVIRSVFNRIYSLIVTFLRFLGLAKVEVQPQQPIIPDFKKHLPDELYAKCLEFKLIETIEEQRAHGDSDASSIFAHQKGTGSQIEKLTIRFLPARKSEFSETPEHVFIEHEPAKIEDNYGGEKYVFSNKKLIHCTFYDAEGLDYVPNSSFSPSEAEQREVINHIISDRLSHFK